MRFTGMCSWDQPLQGNEGMGLGRKHLTEMKSQGLTGTRRGMGDAGARTALRAVWHRSRGAGFLQLPLWQVTNAGCPSEEAVTLGEVVLFSRWQFLKRDPSVWSQHHHQHSQQLEVWITAWWRENVGSASQHPWNCAKHKTFLVTYRQRTV